MIDLQFFIRHRKKILWLANSRLGKYVFRAEKMGHELLKRKKIAFILPNSIGFIKYKYPWSGNPEQEVYQQFFTRNEYAIKLSRVLFWEPVAGVAGFDGAPLFFRPAFVRAVGIVIALLGGVKITPLFFAPTTTFNSNAGGDGRNHQSNATFATAHDAASGTATPAEASSNARYELFGGTYFIHRSFFPFDTSSIGAGNKVSAATFSWYFANSGSDNSETLSDSLVASTQADNTNLVDADYSKIGTTKYATDVTWASIIAAGAGYVDFAMNSSGIAAVSVTGYTPLATRTDKDISNTAPTLRGYLVDITFANSGSNKPKLAVTYSKGGPAGTLLTLGVG